jgi:hypothetical protein
VVAGGLVAAADPAGEDDLLLDREEGSLSDLLEVDLQVAPVQRGGRRGLRALRLLEERGGAVEPGRALGDLGRLAALISLC